MIQIKFIPSYVFDQKYNINYIHAMKLEDGSYLYQQCFSSKLAATRKLNQLYKRFGKDFGDKFIMCPITEVTSIN